MSDTKHDDEFGQPYRHAHSRMSVLFMVLTFFVVIYLLNVVIHFYENQTGKPMITADTRSCDSNKPGSNPPPPAIPPFNWRHTALITLWFDDGWLSQYTVGYPILQEEKLTAAESIATRFVCKLQFMTWDQLRTLQNSGWETTAHTISHSCDLSYYNTDNTKYELAGSKQIIESHGMRADQFVMPCGFSTAEMQTIFGNDIPPIVTTAKEYFGSYRTTKSTRLNDLPIIDPYNLKALQIYSTTTIDKVKAAIEEAEANKSWLIIVFHQIDDSNRLLSVTPENFRQIIHLVKASGIPVVLPSQVLAIKTTPTIN